MIREKLRCNAEIAVIAAWCILLCASMAVARNRAEDYNLIAKVLVGLP
jgi:hypothetical protein